MLQESALKTYLFTYGNYYSSLSLEQLSTMFDMPQKKVGCGWDCCLPSMSKVAAAATAACLPSRCWHLPVLLPFQKYTSCTTCRRTLRSQPFHSSHAPESLLDCLQICPCRCTPWSAAS